MELRKKNPAEIQTIRNKKEMSRKLPEEENRFPSQSHTNGRQKESSTSAREKKSPK